MQIDTMPEELDEINRKLMQLQIEKVSIKKDDSETAQKRLAEMEKDIAELTSKQSELTAKWQSEKDDSEKQKDVKKKLDIAKLNLQKAMQDADYNTAAKIQNKDIPEFQAQAKANA